MPAYEFPQVINFQFQLDLSVKPKTHLINLRDHVVSVTIATPLQVNLLTTIDGTSKIYQ